MKVINIIKGANGYSKLYPSKIICESKKEYDTNDIFENLHNFYFEIVEINYDFKNNVKIYTLLVVGYWCKVRKFNPFLLNHNLTLVTDKEKLKKINIEKGYL